MPNTPFAEQRRVPLPGSERAPFIAKGNARLPFATPEVVSSQVLPSHEHITVSVVVRPKTAIDPARLSAGHGPVSRERFAEMHGADPDSVALVKSFAEAYDLQVEPDLDAARRTRRPLAPPWSSTPRPRPPCASARAH